jgi:hypothetical protein
LLSKGEDCIAADDRPASCFILRLLLSKRPAECRKAARSKLFGDRALFHRKGVKKSIASRRFCD